MLTPAAERERLACLKRGRAERNRAYHGKMRDAQDHILLRLQKGQQACIDAAAAAAGLSRAGLAQLYLAPFCAALTAERIEKLSGLGASQRIGLSAALGRLIDQATVEPAQAPPPEIGSEFDHLFGSER